MTEVRLGVSSCLVGEEVRATGGHSRDRFLVNTLGRWVTWIPVCPEVEMGMPVPRPTIRLVGDVDRPRLVASRGDVDHTDAMRRWAEGRIAALADLRLDGYVFKKNSPSCGLHRVRVYDDHGRAERKGRGMFARMVTDAFPLLPVEEDGRLNDPRLRENFIERVFAHRRWRHFLEEEPSPRGLVAFHTSVKLAVLAHSPEHYRRLGRVVADAGGDDFPARLDAYASLFHEALRELATPGRHRNVMEHLAGFLKEELDARDKRELAGAIEDYHRGLLPLVVPLTLLRHHLGRHDVPAWVHEQVYLEPYPRELMLRNHV